MKTELEEAAEKTSKQHYVDQSDYWAVGVDSFKRGAKWQQQNSYSEEDINIMFDTLKENSIDNKITITNVDLFISSWKKQFKNK